MSGQGSVLGQAVLGQHLTLVAVVSFAASSPSGMLGQQLTNSATSSMTRWLLPHFFRVVFVEGFS